MKITDIECHILLVPDVRKDVTSSAQDDIVVLVHTDEGITGIGEKVGYDLADATSDTCYFWNFPNLGVHFKEFKASAYQH